MTEQKRSFREHIASAGKAASQAYSAVGGVQGAARHAQNYARETFGEAGTVESRTKQAHEYMHSDEGRANVRHSAASAFHRFLQDKSKKAYKAGGVGYLAGAVFQFAHQAFESHMKKLGSEQRLYRDVARVKRGAPEIKHMSHEDLRNVIEHAESYGGKDNEKIKNAAHAELVHRAQRTQAVRTDIAKKHTSEMMQHRAEEKARLAPMVGRAERKQARASAKNQEKIAQQQHAANIARLREKQGHVQESARALQAIKTQGAQARKALRDQSPTGPKPRTGAATSTRKAHGPIQIVERTAHGGKDSKGNYYTNEEIAASRNAATKSKKPRAPRMR